jgi:hypothetical protein
MIARIAYFEGLTEQQKAAQDDNVARRFKAAITSQPGIVALLYLEKEDGTRISLSVWESLEALKEGGTRANATPLLLGQRGEDIPSPDRFEIWHVSDLFISPEGARA